MILKRSIYFIFGSALFIFWALGAAAQNGPDKYETNWKKVKEYTEKGLTSSALRETDHIYQMAKKSKNTTQIIKSLLYKNQLAENITEDATIRMIDTIQRETAQSSGAEKSILQSITAQLYQNYLDYNRYRLYSVSSTPGFQKDDIATWSISDLLNKISALYDSSIQNPELQSLPLTAFDDIIDKGNVRYLRPTLFDLLAHRALDYFMSSEPDISRPAYAFEISDTGAFSPSDRFINLIFKSKDSSSAHLRALQIFQQLERLHQHEIKPLHGLELERLAFVNQFSVLPDKQQRYIAALKYIYQHRPDESVSEAGYLWAQQMYNIASREPSQKGIYAITDVVPILEEIISKYPGSEGGIQAANLLTQIRQPSLSVETEKVNLIGKPFRALVSYQNVSQIHLRVIPISDKQREEFRNAENPQERFRTIAKLKPLKEWTQLLPAIADFLTHRVEIKIDDLPAGSYILLAGKEKRFATDSTNVMSAVLTFVSNISYIQNGPDHIVLNRESGKPLAGANVNIMRSSYNYKIRKYQLFPYGSVVTDKNGFFRIQQDSLPVNYSIRLDIRSGNDRLYLDDQQRVYYYGTLSEAEIPKSQPQMDSRNARIFFFTDRSIYRPGQLVYYKGIGVTKGLESNKSQLLKTDTIIQIFLINANNERVDSATAILNDYGSLSGKFTLPSGQLTGNYRITTATFNSSDVNFNVEEYKRPRFLAEFKKIENTYRIHDTVQIAGHAEAYAGSPVDGAGVQYRVVRKTRFIYPWLFRKIIMPNVRPMEIAHGETVTDEKGNFQISFPAIPDLQIDASTEPVFDYEISADITDINGETRSTSITVPIGYKALNLQIKLTDKSTFLSDKMKELTITAQNLGGAPQQVTTRIKVSKLQTPDRLLRTRYWASPDTFVLSQSAYIRLFPHDIYQDEDQPETWNESQIILESTDPINGTGDITLGKPMQSGWYKAEITANDRFGNPVKDVKYFQILQPGQKKPDNNYAYLLTALDKEQYQPGETAHLYLNIADNIHLIQQIEKEKDTALSYGIRVAADRIQDMPFPITEKDRGGFYVTSLFVKDNRFYTFRSYVNVPWDNKQLAINLETYRDKTLPGSREDWKVKISGEKGQKVSAEMLATMYDESLDQFRPHSWGSMNLWPSFYSADTWRGSQNFVSIGSMDYIPPVKYMPVKEKIYDRIAPLPDQLDRIFNYSPRMMKRVAGAPATNEVALQSIASAAQDTDVLPAEEAQKSNQPASNDAQPLRTNFNETAFFYPELKTDSDGNISFSFTMPEALTRWKLMMQAHTKDLAIGYAEKSVITQKDLMVIPNPPRFLREGDQVGFSAKVVNMTSQEINVAATFHLLNASTLLPVDNWFKNTTSEKILTIPANQSRPVTFSIEVPKGFNDLVLYKITATAPRISDGEEAFLPVVSNRVLVTESLPIEMRGTGTKDFTFSKLANSANSSTLTNYGLSVEYSTNPAWYPLQALPYLSSNPAENTEQVFNRYFSNALATNIANSSPALLNILQRWKTEDTAALLSKLQQNQELKSVLLEETPWVLDAKNEEQQKRNIALLFDAANIRNNLAGTLKTITDRQSPNGGFTWVKGGPDDRYMTQYILADLGHLKKLNAWPEKDIPALIAMAAKAIHYLDERMAEDYARLKKEKAQMSNNQLSALMAHYLYARSFFTDIPVNQEYREAYKYFSDQAKKYWLDQRIYVRGLLALSLQRNGETKAAKDIVQSLRENAVVDTSLGMYWKDWNQRSWWWYQAPIESQALMIEVFSDVAKDQHSVNLLKTWLLKNKQTNNWKTTRATAEAVYALLLQGSDWLSVNPSVQIKLGNTVINSRDENQQAGTGYFLRKIDGSRVGPEMGHISVTTSTGNKPSGNELPSWGAVYWQYFEDMDKISFATTPLSIDKKLFVEKNTDTGPVLKPILDGDELRVGDKIKVRIELRVNQDMDYVHMKDMRASTMEPVNVLSQYKWQGGLGYYESTGDISTNFFFDHLRKGTYVFEYPMFVSLSGDFSNGITTIQCMYAPEFTAHSEGIRVTVE